MYIIYYYKYIVRWSSVSARVYLCHIGCLISLGGCLYYLSFRDRKYARHCSRMVTVFFNFRGCQTEKYDRRIFI